MKKRLLSLLVAIVLLFTMCNVMAMADSGDHYGDDYNWDNLNIEAAVLNVAEKKLTLTMSVESQITDFSGIKLYADSEAEGIAPNGVVYSGRDIVLSFAEIPEAMWTTANVKIPVSVVKPLTGTLELEGVEGFCCDVAQITNLPNFKIASATIDPNTNKVTFTFTQPVHINTYSQIFLCTRPEPSGQVWAQNAQFKYVDKDNHIIQQFSYKNTEDKTVTGWFWVNEQGKPVNASDEVVASVADGSGALLAKSSARVQKGADQVLANSVSYIDPVTVNEKQYSTQITIGFNTLKDPYTPYMFQYVNGEAQLADLMQSGVRFVEYSWGTDAGNGTVAKQSLVSIYDTALEANYYTGGNNDICWAPMGGWEAAMVQLNWVASTHGNGKFAYDTLMTVSPYTIDSIIFLDKNTINLTLSREAKQFEPDYAEELKLGEKAATSVTQLSEKSYIVNFADDISEETLITVPSDMFTDSYLYTLDTIYTNYDIENLKVFKNKDLGLTVGTAYNFMNTDTGRSITVEGKDEFTLAQTATGYALKDNEKFVNLETGALQDGEYSFNLLLTDDYQRYQICLNAFTKVLGDEDKGSDTKATLALYEFGNRNIETGWYITANGDERPAKIAVVGDSITCGVMPGTGEKVGFRKALSEKLIEEYGRVVFVGSLKHIAGGNTTAINNTTIDDAQLNRHEGHSGWVIHNSDNYQPSASDDNNRGIDDDGIYLLKDGVTQEERHVRKILQEKYAPDTIMMMIGINDIGMANAYNGDDAKLNVIASSWQTLVENILADLPADGRLIVGKMTPRASEGEWSESQNAAITKLNNKLYDLVMAKTFCDEQGVVDTRISFADNYGYVYNAGAEAISSDTIHPSAIGYAAIAESYFDAYAKRTVYFMNNDNTEVVELVDVAYGADAVAPAAPEVEGFEFDDWEGDYTGVTANTAVYAKYKEASTTIIYGDANNDTSVNGSDLTLLAQSVAKWSVTVSDGADANGDDAVNGSDLTLLAQHIAKWSVVLGK